MRGMGAVSWTGEEPNGFRSSTSVGLEMISSSSN